MLVHRALVAVVLCAATSGCPGRRDARELRPDAAVEGDTAARLRQLATSIGRSRGPRTLDAALAARLVRLSLDCVDREYPNKPNDVKGSDAEAVPPRRLHPAFYGCFDWHSAVHGHWAMVRVLRTVRGLDPQVARAIRAALQRPARSPGLTSASQRSSSEEHSRATRRPRDRCRHPQSAL
jgi:hypothetical protein